jgi:hypothetical protein
MVLLRVRRRLKGSQNRSPIHTTEPGHRAHTFQKPEELKKLASDVAYFLKDLL